MKVLIACEFSGIVRDAFIAKGHDAMSCDLLPTERPGPHYQGDVLEILNDGWDMMIAHPPCTYLCVAGFHMSKKSESRMMKSKEAFEFVKILYNAPIPKICIENPVGVLSSWFRKPDQIINPSDFGIAELKKTCLWIKGLPPLMLGIQCNVNPTKSIIRKSGMKIGKPYNYYWRQGKSSHDRSRTFPCIAAAMAEQWG